MSAAGKSIKLLLADDNPLIRDLVCKALDKAMEITGIVLVEKTGGKSGHFRRRAVAAKPIRSKVRSR